MKDECLLTQNEIFDLRDISISYGNNFNCFNKICSNFDNFKGSDTIKLELNYYKTLLEYQEEKFMKIILLGFKSFNNEFKYNYKLEDFKYELYKLDNLIKYIRYFTNLYKFNYKISNNCILKLSYRIQLINIKVIEIENSLIKSEDFELNDWNQIENYFQ